LSNPSVGNGTHVVPFWHNTDKVFIVNGQCNKADGNFLGAFNFKEIGNEGIVLGSYPSGVQDVQRIYEAGCTAVLDVQTDNDRLQRQVDSEQLESLFKRKGITRLVQVQVSDVYEDQYAQHLFEAAKVLHRMVEVEKKKVYLHCSSGVSRGPTLLMVYLSLYCKLSCWENVDQVYEYVENEYMWQDANKTMVRLVIEKNKDF
jgi:hypothetical protein